MFIGKNNTNDINFLFFCFYFFCRIRKLRSRRNSDDLILGNRVLRLILNLEVFLFGVIVEMMRIRSGKMLTPVRNPSRFFIISFSVSLT